MAYKPHQITEKVEIPDHCEQRNHWENLIIWGFCKGCCRTIFPATEDEPVFTRAARILKPYEK